MTMKKAVHSNASAFQRRGSSCVSGCVFCELDTVVVLLVDLAARNGGLDKTSLQGGRFGQTPEIC
jgi:hypothetical protein